MRRRTLMTLMSGLAVVSLGAACAEDASPDPARPDMTRADMTRADMTRADMTRADMTRDLSGLDASSRDEGWSPEGDELVPKPSFALELDDRILECQAGSFAMTTLRVEGADGQRLEGPTQRWVEGAPPGLEVTWGELDEQGRAPLTIAAGAQVVGSFELILRARRGDEVRSAALLMRVLPGPDTRVTLGGVLRDALGQPLQGWSVRVSSRQSPVQTDASGRYLIEGGLLPYDIAFERPTRMGQPATLVLQRVTRPGIYVTAPPEMTAAEQLQRRATLSGQATPSARLGALDRIKVIVSTEQGYQVERDLSSSRPTWSGLPIVWGPGDWPGGAALTVVGRYDVSGVLTGVSEAKLDELSLVQDREAQLSVALRSTQDELYTLEVATPLQRGYGATITGALCRAERMMWPLTRGDRALTFAAPALAQTRPCAVVQETFQGRVVATRHLPGLVPNQELRIPTLTDQVPALMTPRASDRELRWRHAAGGLYTARFVLAGGTQTVVVRTDRPSVDVSALAALGVDVARGGESWRVTVEAALTSMSWDEALSPQATQDERRFDQLRAWTVSEPLTYSINPR